MFFSFMISSLSSNTALSILGICKVLCTWEGILINNVIINKTILTSWLEQLTDTDWSENTLFALLNPDSDSSTHERIHLLLSPKDPQDVPRAIKLLSLCGDLHSLDASALDPSEQATHHALSLLSDMLDALIELFINPALSLTEQITCLVKFAHISCTLFLKHESDFMPLHLYSDLQCMFKTAVCRVACTMILNPKAKVYLCLLGDDVLEVLFGQTRMIGGHSPNVDVDELCNRFGSALRLDKIFQDHPQWEHRLVCLKLKRGRDLDHLSPHHWKGELHASSCDLQLCWEIGVD